MPKVIVPRVPSSVSTTASQAGRRLVERFNAKGQLRVLPEIVKTISGTEEEEGFSQSSIGSAVSNHTVTKEEIEARKGVVASGAAGVDPSVGGPARVNSSASGSSSILDRYPAAAAGTAAAGEAPAQEEKAKSKSGVFGGRRHKRRSRTHRKSKRHTKRSKKRRS